jgi:uncharacterized protein
MVAMNSSIYVGSIAHRRLRPKSHRLRYRVFALLLDLDELPALDKRLRLFSLGRFNLFSFRAEDHLFARSGDLRSEVESALRKAGLETRGGAIRLLTMPRILGYGFNPLSIFFCYRVDGALQAILYEVNNTFGQRHCYLFPVETDGRALRHACEKQLYVSPFMAMEMVYSFRIKPPDDAFTISISVADEEGDVLVATQRLARVALDDRALMRVFLSHPLLTLKVIAGIHYEALLIWLKGVGLHVRPPPPGHTVTVVANKNREKESLSCQI